MLGSLTSCFLWTYCRQESGGGGRGAETAERRRGGGGGGGGGGGDGCFDDLCRRVSTCMIAM